MIPLLYTALYYRQDGPEMIGTLRAESPEREISIQQPEPLQKRSLWLSNIFFVGAVHLVAAIGAIYVKPSLKTVVFCLLCWQAAGIGSTIHKRCLLLYIRCYNGLSPTVVTSNF